MADSAATGLALLTYMAAGYTNQDEKYRDTVRRGLDWLVKHQSADGNLSYRGSDPTHPFRRDDVPNVIASRAAPTPPLTVKGEPRRTCC